MTGTIESLCTPEGKDRPTYGFIRGDDKVNYFFFGKSMQQTTKPFDQLRPGMKVEFISIEHPKGKRALEVRVVG